MAIINLPIFNDMPYVNKNGGMTTDAILYNDQLWQSLNVMVFLVNSIITSSIINDGSVNNGTIINQGVKFPPYTTAEIVGLEPDADNGTVWFNTTLSKLQLKTSTGTIQTIQSV